jgi:hypothetical protein
VCPDRAAPGLVSSHRFRAFSAQRIMKGETLRRFKPMPLGSPWSVDHSHLFGAPFVSEQAGDATVRIPTPWIYVTPWGQARYSIWGSPLLLPVGRIESKYSCQTHFDGTKVTQKMLRRGNSSHAVVGRAGNGLKFKKQLLLALIVSRWMRILGRVFKLYGHDLFLRKASKATGAMSSGFRSPQFPQCWRWDVLFFWLSAELRE